MAHERLKRENIVELTREFSHRFTYLEDSPNIANFRQADHQRPETLLPFWGATVALGQALMRRVPATDNPSALIVCIPRGAYPFAEGARTIIPHADVLVTNDGGLRTDGPLIPDGVPIRQVGTLVIADPVLDTGATLDRTLAGLDRRIERDRLIMLSVISHPDTARRVLQQYPDLHLITADTEDKFIPAPDGRGRHRGHC